MKSKLESTYLQLPVWLQNIALTLYGFKLQRNRHSGDYPAYLNRFTSHLRWRPEELLAYQSRRLSQIVEHAGRTVPYYRQCFRDNHTDVNQIKTPDDLQDIPLLDKEVVRAQAETLVSDAFPRPGIAAVHTTGTTGTPLQIYCNADVRQKNYAFFDRWLASVGINHKAWRATFGGRIVVPAKQSRPPFWRTSRSQRNALYSSYHLIDRNIPYYIEALRRSKPHYIDSYPSSLYTLASYANRHGIRLGRITDGLVTSAETVFPDMRQEIESAFGLPVYDQYGAAEMCVFVAQCPEGQYHIHSDYALIEFLKADGSCAVPGEEAELVCTGLINPVMPLIRYRIGDRGILSDAQCPCGLPFPVMAKLLGRMDDVIVTPDGRKVGRLSPVLKGFPVKEAQYIQERDYRLRVVIVKGEGFLPETERGIESELRKRLGDEIRIVFEYVRSIPRGTGGKLKTIISRCICK